MEPAVERWLIERFASCSATTVQEKPMRNSTGQPTQQRSSPYSVVVDCSPSRMAEYYS